MHVRHGAFMFMVLTDVTSWNAYSPICSSAGMDIVLLDSWQIVIALLVAMFVQPAKHSSGMLDAWNCVSFLFVLNTNLVKPLHPLNVLSPSRAIYRNCVVLFGISAREVSYARPSNAPFPNSICLVDVSSDLAFTSNDVSPVPLNASSPIVIESCPATMSTDRREILEQL